MEKIRSIGETRWVRRVIIGLLFVASALSYPILFHILWRALEVVGAVGASSLIAFFKLLDRIWIGFPLVLLILVHEWFHLGVMRKYGIEAIGPFPVPFLGAFVDTKELLPSLWSKFTVVICGPLSGLFAVPLFAIGANLQCPELIALALLWLCTNVVNLLPIFPLDGGLAVSAILGSVGKGLAGAFVILWLATPIIAAYIWNPAFAAFTAFAVLELVLERRKRQKSPPPVKMTIHQIVIAVGSYLGAVAIMVASLHLMMHPRWFLISAWR